MTDFGIDTVDFGVLDTTLRWHGLLPGYQKLRVHYRHGCKRARYGYADRVSDDMEAVTCKSCVARIQKYNLRPRCDFEKVPTFDVRAEGIFRYMPGTDGKREWGTHLVFHCPVCGQENAHGGLYDQPGKGDGHRVAHCNCWEDGYYIREVSKENQS